MHGEGDQAFLTRTAKGLRDFFGFTAPGHAQTKRNAEWLRQQFEAADEQMRTDYLRAAARHPHLFHNDRNRSRGRLTPAPRSVCHLRNGCVAHIPHRRCQIVNALHVDRNRRQPLQDHGSDFRFIPFPKPIRVPVSPACVAACAWFSLGSTKLRLCQSVPQGGAEAISDLPVGRAIRRETDVVLFSFSSVPRRRGGDCRRRFLEFPHFLSIGKAPVTRATALPS